MKKQILTFLLLSQFFGYIIAQTTIAVIEFDARNISAGEVATLTDRFRDELTKTNQFTVIERGKMEEVLKEQGFRQSGCVSDECVVEVGQLIGVQQMVGGSIGKVGNVYSVSARIIDVQSGKIINVTTYDHSGDIGSLLTVGMQQVIDGLISGANVSVASKAQGFGSLYMTSEPSGANIWIDGIKISGLTPVMIDNQNVGVHEILAQKGGYSTRQLVTIIKDDVNKINLLLQLGTGKLKVVTDPFEARVSVDGVEKGLTPLVISEIKAGYHDISINYSGYSEYKKSVLINTNIIEELNVKLKKLASMTISSDPVGATILVNGIIKGKTPKTIEMTEGEHVVVLQKEGYNNSETSIKLQPGEELTRELKLIPWYGGLTVTTSPAGANVYIDGTLHSTSPAKIDQLITGNHIIDIKLKDYLQESRQVRISHNKSRTINVNLTSRASIESKVAKLHKQKMYFFVGSTGVFVSALLLNNMANNNYDKYQTAVSNATELHETIDQQLLIAKVLLATGLGSAIPAIKYHNDQRKLRDQLKRSEK